MLLLLALCAPAHAEAAAWTFSYRALAGASVRYEAPLTDHLSALLESGISTWIIPGDDPEGGSAPPIDLRSHLKVGLDLHPRGHWYFGPRIAGARNQTLNTGRSFWEVGALFTGGLKWTSKGGLRAQVGGGLGGHLWIDTLDPAVAFFPLPHVELRLGFARN